MEFIYFLQGINADLIIGAMFWVAPLLYIAPRVIRSILKDEA